MKWKGRYMMLLSVVAALVVATMLPTASGEDGSVEMVLDSYDGSVYAGEEVFVTYTIELTNLTYLNVSYTAVHWDTESHAGNLDFTLYPYESNILSGEADGSYTVNFTSPTEEGTVYFIVHAIVNGTDHYVPSEHEVEVLPIPEISMTEAPLAALVDTEAEVSWTITLADPEDVLSTAVYYDVEGHGPAIDKGDYPFVSEVREGAEGNAYSANISLPVSEGPVYYIIHASINGRDFYSIDEYIMTAKPVPTVSLVQAPPVVFVDENILINWTIEEADAGNVPHTAVHWDTVSHADTPLNLSEYGNVSEVLQGSETGNYSVTITSPSEPTIVYFVVHAEVLGHDFYADQEFALEVKALPTIQVISAPDAAFAGEEAHMLWNVSGADPANVSHAAVHWDNLSHAGELDYTLYANMQMGGPGGDLSEYLATLETPDEEVTLYYIFHARVHGRDFYGPQETTLVVRFLPTIENVEYKEEVTQGDKVTVTLTIGNASADEVSRVTVYWDTSSHSSMEPADYPKNVTTTMADSGTTYKLKIDTPEDKDKVYFIVHAEIDGRDYYSEAEHSVKLEELVPGPGVALALMAIATAVIAAVAVNAGRERR